MLHVAFNFIFDTRQFARSCEKWKEKFTGDKNWVSLKIHLTKAHKRMRKSKPMTDNAGYETANNATMQETTIHLANLALNTAANQNIVSSMLETNARLGAKIAAVNATLVVAVADISALRVQLNGMGSGGRG